MTKRRPIAERFWEKVGVRGLDDCWMWTGSTDGRGYGQMSTKFGLSPAKAHRVAYELEHGEIPSGMVVRHRCDNPPCCNHRHLELGTQLENARDAVERDRMNPASRLNLRPGAKGFHGAGPLSNKELSNGIRQ